MIEDESLEIMVNETLEMLVDESDEMIVNETLKLDEEHLQTVITDYIFTKEDHPQKINGTLRINYVPLLSIEGPTGLWMSMLDGKLMFVNEHGKPLEMEVNKSKSIPSTYNVASKKVVDETRSVVVGRGGGQGVESDKDEVEMPDDEMSRYIASIGGGGLFEDDLDFYD
nr:U5 small nuclear ribonucleoprotein helicase [Tanacetum cinerariifolium]